MPSTLRRLLRPAFLPGLLRFLCAAFLASGLSLPAHATTVSNTASARWDTASGPATVASNTVTRQTLPPPTPSVVTFYQYAPGVAGSTDILFDGGQYDTTGSGSYAALPSATALDGGTLPTGAPLAVRPTNVFHAGEPVFITLADANRNTDPAVRETVLVTVTTSTGDTETLLLLETGPNTGVFAAVVPSVGPSVPVSANDGHLSLAVNATITVHYQDIYYPDDVSVAEAMVDPFGTVFDSATGVPVNGVQVTVIDVATGQPAVVYGDDGVSIFPSTVTTGGSVTDSGGAVYNLPAGEFRFPYVKPGQYRFVLVTPANYLTPSTVAPANLATKAGGERYSIQPGSYGDAFTLVPGPALNIDIPIDPIVHSLVVQKVVSQPEASAGDFLQYRVSVQNVDATATASAVSVHDVLPFGLRYQKGSLRVNGKKAGEPVIAGDGRALTVTVGNIAPGTTADIRYVVLVNAGLQAGTAVNSASASGNGGTAVSNTASVAVKIREPLFSGRFTLIGRVFEGECTTAWDQLKPVANARILLEDGTWVVTDADGQYHFEALHPGTHVVQLDTDSLSGGLEPVSCIDNTRFAGNAYSQFVDVKGGGLWRADFVVHRRSENVGIRVHTQLDTGAPTESGGDATAPAGMPTGPGAAAPAPSPAISALATPTAPAAVRPLHTVGLHVNFASCRSTLKRAAQRDFDALARQLEGVDIAGVEIIGHTDLRDLSRACTAKYGDNQGLSEARAKAVAEALVTQFHLQRSQVLIGGRGRDVPVASNHTFFGRAENRRADVELRFHLLDGAPVPAGSKPVDPAASSPNAPYLRTLDGTPAPAATAPDEGAALVAGVAAGTPGSDAAGAAPVVRGVKQRIDVDGSAPVDNLRVMAMLPDGYVVEPGTTRVDGQPAADPAQDGVLLTFTLGRVAGDGERSAWARVVEFRTHLSKPAPPTAGAGTSAPTVTPISDVEKYTLSAEFDSCRAALHGDAEAAVDDLVAKLAGADIARIELVGNTDDRRLSSACRRTYKDNRGLSEARARVIGERLAKALGLTPSQIVSRGDGSDHPVAANTSADGRARNRRTDVRVFLRAELAGSAADVKYVQAGEGRVAAGCSGDYQLKAIANFSLGGSKPAQTPAASSGVQCPGGTLVSGTAADAQTDDLARASDAENASERQSVTVQDAGVTAADADLAARRQARAAIVDDVTASGVDIDFTQGQSPGTGWLFPAENFNPRAPSARVVIKHLPGQSVRLLLADGTPASDLAFDGVRLSTDEQVAVSSWRAVPLVEGPNHLRAEILDADGKVVATLERTLNYANTPANVALVPEQSILRADGVNKPVVAIRLTDRWGRPVRAGVSGTVQVNAPYLLQDEVDHDQKRVLAGLDRFLPQYHVQGDDGIAYIELAPTTESGALVLDVGVANGTGNRTQQLRTWLAPAARDWVVVGFAEGTVGYNTLKGNMQPLQQQGIDEGAYSDGQVSLYAKGRVLGSWLLTMAYDSDKSDERDRQKSLLAKIDPKQYYTLYGDGTQQANDAPSQDKLYLKLERDQFYALFGDYETGLTQTQLSRYSRTLNGVKVENGAGRVTFILFGAETPQNGARDEIQGDGTSGLYRLSQNNIVLNSEQVTLEVRDRLHSEQIVETRQLTRHLDYEIDYAAGTLFFKQPINSRDANFNPEFIVAQYETLGTTQQQLNSGGRVAFRLDEAGRVQVGVSAIRDENTLGTTGLGGADVKVKVGEGTEVRVEAANTNGTQGASSRNGDAWLAEIEHHDGKVDALMYTRRLDDQFGVGQQNATERGQEKTGVQGKYRLDEHWSVDGDLFQQQNLATDAQRAAGTAKLHYDTVNGGVYAGAQVVDDQQSTGPLAGEQFRSDQAILGGNRFYLNRKLEITGEADSALGGNRASIDYPDRYMVGANYALTDHVRLLAGEEFAESDFLTTMTSRAGLQVLPWEGARLESTLNQQQSSEYGPRTFGQYGLTQAMMINDRWGVDFSADASQTLRESSKPSVDVSPAQPVVTGGMTGARGPTEDFYAFSTGATYRAPIWSWNGRVETRYGETSDRVGVVSNFLRQATAGIAFATGAQAFHTQQDSGADGYLATLDLSWAWRPLGWHWSVLDRLEFRYESVSDGTSLAGTGLFGDTSLVAGSANTRRIINNFALNRVSREWAGEDRHGNLFNRYERNQFSFYYGAKYAFDTFDGQHYAGYTDLVGVEVRHDLTSRWDIGVQASSLNAWSVGTHQYAFGPMVGCSPVKNGWVTLGYNVRGFVDPDFDAARYTAQGPYLQLRIKFDQNTKLGWKGDAADARR